MTKSLRNNFPRAGALCLLALLAMPGGARAASAGCDYPEVKVQGVVGIGGTGSPAEGGIGGTGAIAEGSGIGGTGNTEGPDLGKPAGSVIFSSGEVKAQLKGQTRPLAKGASICVGETIVTSGSGIVQVKMADGGMISVRPATRLRIDVFHYDGKEDGTEKSRISLLEGGFRALTGLIGHTHKENYKITTPGAIIGIRGTDHEPMYIPTPPPGQKAEGVPGTYDKVNSGGVVITTPNGSVDVRPNEIGYVPNDSSIAPVILKEIPRFYQQEKGAEGGRQGGEARGREGAEGEGGRGQEGGRNGETGRRHEFRTPEPRSEEMRVPEAGAHEIRSSESGGERD